MKLFTDAAGRTWSLSITIGSAMRVRDRLRVDGDALVFEQYDDGIWEWIEKYRIPATE